MTEPYLSVILPVYKCGKCIEPLYQRLVTALEQEGVDFEIIFVDDRGDDAEWRAIEAVAAPDHRVRAFRHRLNYGQPAAIATGLARSKGRYALVMDADLQDPPEIIGRFLAQAQEGSDIVLSVKTVRRDSLLRRLSDACISRLFPIYTRFPNGLDYGCFVLLSRPVVERLLAEPDRNLQFTKLLDRLDGLVSFVYYEPARRFDGPSSYSFLKLVRHTCVLMGPEFWSSRLKASTVAALVFLVIATCI
ncbi:MAG: glycosyltransferase family 2 protein, partial [Candidatus Obscuribacterales bacterium]|nr:glycosyltransferase family 2 protein [Candidatus Obscuribacterales bacterium]